MSRPQSETWRRAQRMPPRPEQVSGWLAGLGILLMIVAALGTGVANRAGGDEGGAEVTFRRKQTRPN